MAERPWRVLLYYLYVQIPEAEEYCARHRELCESLGLRGRIIVGSEGINGTVSGNWEATESYINTLKNDPLTSAVEFKIDEEPSGQHVFPKLSVKLRDEIVTLGLGSEDINPNEVTGKHLSPTEWREALDDPNAVVIDARNDYEWKLGHFEGAILPDVPNFRDLPKWVRENREQLEGKRILTYCTGGIRCEKFSGFLVREGFEDVSQLDGGIVTYGKDEKVKGDKYLGKCYVFDERIGVPVNRTDGALTISKCAHCGESSDRYRNCAWKPCNDQFFCCEGCEEEWERCCCEECLEKKRTKVREERTSNVRD